jgi:hypothetical protein
MTRNRRVSATCGGMSHDTLSFTALMGNVHQNRHTYQSKTIKGIGWSTKSLQNNCWRFFPFFAPASYGWDKLLASNKKSYLAGRCIIRTTHAQNSYRLIKHDEPWRPPLYHGRHGDPLPAPMRRNISQ